MLTYIHIRNFAIIDELDLELSRGMSVITGETGAGKSILVDALGFVLGDRTGTGVVRHGAKQADVSAEFDLVDAPDAAQWLATQDLVDDNNNCLLRRILTTEGRSRGYVNGHPAPMHVLKSVGEKLVDIHGQHEHQSLLRGNVQMHLLDAFGAGDVARVADIYKQWKETADYLATLTNANDNRTERLALLRFQIDELQALNLEASEVPDLDAEHDRLANADRLIDGCQSALNTLYENEDNSAQQLLAGAERSLRELATLDSALAPIAETTASAAVNTAEAAQALRSHLSSLDIDPKRLEWVENRIGSIHDLARKHHVEPAKLPAVSAQLQAEFDDLNQSSERLDELRQHVTRLEKDYNSAAHALHDARVSAAESLDEAITDAMQELGMSGGRFVAQVEWQADRPFSAHGMDRIVFTVSANPGHPLQPLAKVASGGELSRIALAIQVITARAGALPSLVFDEVDSGVGGGVAEIVGRHLRALGDAHQVFCVTHLPQVASQAHRHFHVDKQTSEIATRTMITALENDDRVEELARMLGGVEITDTTRDHAREMMANT